MDSKVIQTRAQAMLAFSRNYLLEDDSGSYEVGEIYRFAFLVMRGPRAFLKAFEAGELFLDGAAISDGYWQFQQHLPAGPSKLMPEENKIIQIHNSEVEKLQQRPHLLQQHQQQRIHNE